MTNTDLNYTQSQAKLDELIVHLNGCKNDFIPPLDEKVNINDYALKIHANAITFEVWNNNDLIGLVAAYFNQENLTAFITNVSVLSNYGGQGIAANLLKNCIGYARIQAFLNIALEVNSNNFAAIRLYEKFGFQSLAQKNENLIMKLNL